MEERRRARWGRGPGHAKGRRPQDIRTVPFEQILPMALRDRVANKGTGTSDLACIPEMQVMLACFKKHEFEQSKCLKEVDTFQKCFHTYVTVKEEQMIQERTGVLAPGVTKNISPKLLNNFLRKFPKPK